MLTGPDHISSRASQHSNAVSITENSPESAAVTPATLLAYPYTRLSRRAFSPAYRAIAGAARPEQAQVS
ncbi:MAG TPA: hypothetical protein VFU69_12095, partial [Ktedonobacterales bacterium]|nr:hypothetical protein [Ktedonobacterales bacterium]